MSWKSYYRQPRTTAELRANQDPELEEFGVSIRPSRKKLSTFWDDQPREQSRSWKRQRRTQHVSR